MTALATAPSSDMEFLQPEDTMDLVSSPARHQDDAELDLEYDPMHDEIDEADPDSMIEDFEDDDKAGDHTPDDEMLDKDVALSQEETNITQTQISTHVEEEDVDIMFDEEEHEGLDRELMDPEEFIHDDLDEEFVEDEQHNDNTSNSSTENHATVAEIPMVSAADEANSAQAVIDPSWATANEETLDSAIQHEIVSGNSPKEPVANAVEHQPHSTEAFLQHDSFQEPGNETVQAAPKTADPGSPAAPADAPQSTDTTTNQAPATSLATETQDTLQQEQIHQDTLPPLHVDDHLLPLHTVKVNYLGNQMCLFPPVEGQEADTFFLSDHKLGKQNLNEMLKACRDILSNSIGRHDELVLDVASLGLHIVEGSTYASQLTLSDILDVYLTLCHNDAQDDIEPLYCSLTTRVSLASQYAYLLSAASDDKKFTDIAAEQNEDESSFDEAEYEQNYDVEEHLQYPTEATLDRDEDQRDNAEEVENADDVIDEPAETSLEEVAVAVPATLSNEAVSGAQHTIVPSQSTLDSGHAFLNRSPTSTIRADDAELTVETLARPTDDPGTLSNLPELGEEPVENVMDGSRQEDEFALKSTSPSGDEANQRAEPAVQNGQTENRIDAAHSPDTSITLKLNVSSEENVVDDDIEFDYEEEDAESEANAEDGADQAEGLEEAEEDLFEHENLGDDPDLSIENAELLQSANAGDHTDRNTKTVSPWQPAQAVTPPASPTGSKRKAIDLDDEFDLLETMTPDAKRTRSS